jgi:myosin heavy subunit
MDSQPPNYRQHFLRSPHHIWLALLTLGIGFMTGWGIGLLAGATAYVLGWIYLPDFRFFRRWVDKRLDAERQAVAEAKLAEFIRQRDAALAALAGGRREKYEALAQVCRDIERATAESEGVSPGQLALDTRMRKLDELMWMYLRLLSLDQSIEVFLEGERRENLPQMIEQTEGEIMALSAEVTEMQKEGNRLTLEARQRLLNSRRELFETLQKRLVRFEQTKANLQVVRSEQDRLVEQVKLIRADAVATRNTQALSTRINASMEHLEETNKWLSELSEFKDLVGEIPATDQRIGYTPATIAAAPQAGAPPPLRQTDRSRHAP